MLYDGSKMDWRFVCRWLCDAYRGVARSGEAVAGVRFGVGAFVVVVVVVVSGMLWGSVVDGVSL